MAKFRPTACCQKRQCRKIHPRFTQALLKIYLEDAGCMSNDIHPVFRPLGCFAPVAFDSGLYPQTLTGRSLPLLTYLLAHLGAECRCFRGIHFLSNFNRNTRSDWRVWCVQIFHIEETAYDRAFWVLKARTLWLCGKIATLLRYQNQLLITFTPNGPIWAVFRQKYQCQKFIRDMWRPYWKHIYILSKIARRFTVNLPHCQHKAKYRMLDVCLTM
jgi:hypothetical protein